MNLDEAINIYTSMEEKGIKAPYIVSEQFKYRGSLITNGDVWAIVDEEFLSIKTLPKFIKSQNEALLYINQLDGSYLDGISHGKDDFKRDFAQLMGLTQKSRTNFEVETLEKRISRIEESL